MEAAATAAAAVGGIEQYDMSVAETQSAPSKPKLRWYQPTKSALVGLILLASCVALIGPNVYIDWKRSKTIQAITDRGGKVYSEQIKDSMKKDRSYTDVIEIDLYGSQVSDAELV